MTKKTETNEPDLTEDRIFPVGWGLIYRVVCAPKNWTPEKIADTVSSDDPPGTSHNRWEVAEPYERSDVFNGVNHIQCPDCEDRWHWLLNC